MLPALSPDPDTLDHENYAWHYRVIGYAANGSVQFTKVVPINAETRGLEQAHDEVMGVEGVVQVYTAGPFRTARRVQTHIGPSPWRG